MAVWLLLIFSFARESASPSTAHSPEKATNRHLHFPNNKGLNSQQKVRKQNSLTETTLPDENNSKLSTAGQEYEQAEA